MKLNIDSKIEIDNEKEFHKIILLKNGTIVGLASGNKTENIPGLL